MLIAIPVRLLVFQLLPQEKGSAAPGRSPYYIAAGYCPIGLAIRSTSVAGNRVVVVALLTAHEQK